MSRYSSLFLAGLLPLLLFRWFVPTPDGQIDFWLLWLLAMVLLALPMVFAEVALAWRSGETPLSGMSILTREADASMAWRGFAWLSVLVSVLISALVVSGAGASVLGSLASLGVVLQLPDVAVLAGLMVLSLILSWLGARLLPVGVLLVVIGVALGVFMGDMSMSFVMTPVSLAEWGRAMALALVSVGAGTGLFWFTKSSALAITYKDNASSDGLEGDGLTRQKSKSSKSSKAHLVASKHVLPIWGVQLLSGILALVVSGVNLPPIGQLVYVLGVLCVAGFLLHSTQHQLASRFGLIKGAIATAVLALLMVLIPSQWLTMALLLLSCVAVLLLTVFTGWQMKISHLRKSLNFSSEAIYNVWRVAVRLVVPLSILVGLLGWFL